MGGLFLLGLWLTVLALAIGGFDIVGRYLGLITSVFAVIPSASEVIRLGFAGNPNLETSEHVKPIAAD